MRARVATLTLTLTLALALTLARTLSLILTLTLTLKVKRLFDPDFLLNPGVILNEDPDVHAKNIRHDGLASPLVDRCISCGWCESNCPSRDLTLTPRQRIQVCKEMTTNPLPPYPHSSRTTFGRCPPRFHVHPPAPLPLCESETHQRIMPRRDRRSAGA